MILKKGRFLLGTSLMSSNLEIFFFLGTMGSTLIGERRLFWGITFFGEGLFDELDLIFYIIKRQ